LERWGEAALSRGGWWESAVGVGGECITRWWSDGCAEAMGIAVHLATAPARRHRCALLPIPAARLDADDGVHGQPDDSLPPVCADTGR
jgi:hypothetical protein